jgi:hypothetical protein
MRQAKHQQRRTTMTNLNPREQHHLNNAKFFTVIRGNSRNRIRREFPTIGYAEEWALAHFKGDKRSMIYAVSDEGSAHIKNI